MNKKRPPTALMSDADNTLWDTNGIYADAQLWLLGVVEEATGIRCPLEHRLDFVRQVDQAIAEKHHQRNRYPHALLAYALNQHLRGTALSEAVRQVLLGQQKDLEKAQAEEAGKQFAKRLKRIPNLRPGVDTGLEHTHSAGIPIAVVTEGAADTCRERLQYWGLERFVGHVVAAPKSVELFLRVSNLLAVEPRRCFVVGDQLDRDVAPAIQAGMNTFYFPGGFTPKWALKVDEVKPQHSITTFADVPKILRCRD